MTKGIVEPGAHPKGVFLCQIRQRRNRVLKGKFFYKDGPLDIEKSLVSEMGTFFSQRNQDGSTKETGYGYTFKDGTDSLVKKMVKELRRNGADLRRQCLVEEVMTSREGEQHKVKGVKVNGKTIKCGAILSNANLKNTVEKLFGLSKLPKKFAEQAKAVRLNSTSCQVYIGLKKDALIPERP